MPETVLVVDDDSSILQIVKRHLSPRGFGVVLTDNASEAMLLVKEVKPDIVLCDVEMPGMDGQALCRVLKRNSDARAIPVILMSGKRIEDKEVLSGFEGGADDYVIKPFSLPVLEARLKAVLGRYRNSTRGETKLKRHGIELDPAGRTIKLQGKPVSLTRKEFDLLTTLVSKPNRVLGVPFLLQTVWGYDPADYNDPGTVEVHVSHLRKKLGRAFAKRIVNVPGFGYKFES